MGNEWKINETFATWVINYGPQGERNREWLLPLIEKTNIDQLGDLVKNRLLIYKVTLLLNGQKE